MKQILLAFIGISEALKGMIMAPLDNTTRSKLNHTTESGESNVELNPGRALFRSLFYGTILPSAVIAFGVTRQFSVSIAAALALPLIAIGQGTWGIISYRLFFGKAPVPVSPSHGVVQIVSSSNNDRSSGLNKHDDLNHISFYNRQSIRKSVFDQQEPLRLLVLGDSLAVGVGQSSHITPVLPEVVAKTLSMRFNGRTVFWTCHGQPGASTGWIVRELERAGLQQNLESSNSYDLDDDLVTKSCKASHSKQGSQSSEYLSDTDESTSDDSNTSKATTQQHHGIVEGDTSLEERCVWSERLREHRNRFEKSELLGPYDVVVVITGSNDLKSAFFPFLCKGEDAEFRKEAAERGGSYDQELTRLLHTLHSRMRKFQNRASSVRLSVMKSVQLTVGRIIKRSPSAKESSTSGNFFKSDDNFNVHDDENDNIACHEHKVAREQADRKRKFANGSCELESIHSITLSNNHKPHHNLPLVVLPGLPARALPIFHSNPLRLFAIPIVDILDMNKRKLERATENNVLFVPAPSVSDLFSYENRTGKYWEQKSSEKPLLILRDTHHRDAKRMERELKQYYSSTLFDRLMNRAKAAHSNPLVSVMYTFLSCILSFAVPGNRKPGFSLFSIDSIHPNDDGYDFWGRYIADEIADRLLPPPTQ